ncbi:Pentatricopeptide repeat [Dillenia turbinata]|uniref:Pentatricopeptide repeat n=1 Tax=Dillenia turbinata TaxID=194707 RepID=A0AAN8W773_9MAGN
MQISLHRFMRTSNRLSSLLSSKTNFHILTSHSHSHSFSSSCSTSDLSNPPNHQNPLLKPGFTSSDIDEALRAQSDSDLALHIFRWTAQQHGYKHDHVTYLTMIRLAISGKRYSQAETLIEEVLAEACSINQMKASGVISDVFVSNMIIKACSKCLELDEAIRVFHEMGLYGCEPNAYSYNYIINGFCGKGRVRQGLGFYKEMRKKNLVPSGATYMILICSLSLEAMFEDAVKVVLDMLGYSRGPDLLTLGGNYHGAGTFYDVLRGRLRDNYHRAGSEVRNLDLIGDEFPTKMDPADETYGDSDVLTGKFCAFRIAAFQICNSRILLLPSIQLLWEVHLVTNVKAIFVQVKPRHSQRAPGQVSDRARMQCNVWLILTLY